MAPQLQASLPVEGINYLLVPEVLSFDKNLWERGLYTQNNGLDALSSRAVNELAKKVSAKRPSKEFITYAKENSDLKENEILDAYQKLHAGIKRYEIMTKEILIWRVRSQPTRHPRLISDKPSSDELTSILVTDYKIVDNGNGNYSIDIRGITPDPCVQVNWLRRDGMITREMAELLGAKLNTYVRTNPDLYTGEGLRALIWDFRDSKKPLLRSNWGPWARSFDMGSLLGRKL